MRKAEEQDCVKNVKAVSDMAITKEQAIDILEKFDFFQGQRAGRELWSDKPYETQEEDIKAFSKDVAELKAYIADVVQKSEVERLQAEVERLKKDNEYILMQHRFQRRPSGDCWNDVIEKAKAEVAREIFKEIEKHFVTGTTFYGQRIYSIGVSTFAELKKKYTEGET